LQDWQRTVLAVGYLLCLVVQRAQLNSVTTWCFLFYKLPLLIKFDFKMTQGCQI